MMLITFRKTVKLARTVRLSFTIFMMIPLISVAGDTTNWNSSRADSLIRAHQTAIRPAESGVPGEGRINPKIGYFFLFALFGVAGLLGLYLAALMAFFSYWLGTVLIFLLSVSSLALAIYFLKKVFRKGAAKKSSLKTAEERRADWRSYLKIFPGVFAVIFVLILLLLVTIF